MVPLQQGHTLRKHIQKVTLFAKMKKNTVLQNIWKQKGVPDIDLFRS